MKNIKEVRMDTGLSQSKFAAKFGIPVGTLQAWEQRRQDPPVYIISMIETILNSEKVPANFNPFYDSEFTIKNGDMEGRMLVEMCADELVQLRSEINAVLAHSGNG